MDWISTLLAGSGIFTVLITIVSIACSCLISAIVLGATGFFLYRFFKGMSQNSELVKTGVSAPADASLAGGAHRLRGRQHASLGILHPADQAQAPGRCAIRDAH